MVFGSRIKSIARMMSNPIVLIFLGAVIGSSVAIGFDEIKKVFSCENRESELELTSDGFLSMPSRDVENRSLEAVQVLTFVISACDLLTDVKIEAIFAGSTKIEDVKTVLSGRLPEDYREELLSANHLIVELAYPLDDSSTVTVHLRSSKMVRIDEPKKVEIPDIHVEAKDRDGALVYIYFTQ